MLQEKCLILNHQKVGPDHFKLTLSSSYVVSHAQPGQFINIRCGDTYDPLLRRPFAFHRLAKEKKIFEILYELKGKGTEVLSQYQIGSKLDILGPLGSGFQVEKEKQIFLLVGGGLGVAPLLALAEEIANRSKAIYILIGAKTRDFVLGEADFKKITDQVFVSTDDGSYGQKGFVSDIFLEFLNNQLSVINYRSSVIYACGPKEMLKAIAEISSQKKISCQVSVEENLACGIGVCKGCPIKTKSGYKMVCKDGPVFFAEELRWQD